jgi:hypothetical protein
MKPNAGNALHTLISPPSVLQEVARLYYGYNTWQMSHHVRPNTLAPTVRPNPISVRETYPIAVRAHHTVHCSLLTSCLRHMICREEAERFYVYRNGQTKESMKRTACHCDASQSLSPGALITLVGVPLRKARMSSTASPKNMR